ncbi:hypothetical protein ACHHYP_03198 [Achlya hypogyna]|uniref:Transmembrane protein n=1 Tax=Achlya hypogyna TaxID=1202772 RepID=A0A1V9Z4E7_ACHHY|nr:hypothetical protein ACHHYP_03198 [Achlya hypogyna]
MTDSHSSESAMLLTVDLLLVLLTAAVFGLNLRRHGRNVRDAYSQAITVRLAFVCLVTNGVFFLNVFWQIATGKTGGKVQETLGEVVSGVVEGIVLNSFFALLVLQAGGTDRVVRVFAKETPGRDNAAAVAAMRYKRYRLTIHVFAAVRPILAVLLQTLSTTASPAKYLHALLSVYNVVLLAAALFVVVRTLVALKAEIPPAFQATHKFVVIKLILLLATTQWTAYVFLDKEAEAPQHLKVYWSVCLVEALLLSVAFYAVSAPESFVASDSPRVHLWRLWDVVRDPIPEYKALGSLQLTAFKAPLSPSVLL